MTLLTGERKTQKTGTARWRGKLHKNHVIRRTAINNVHTTYWWVENLENKDSSMERETAQKLSI